MADSQGAGNGLALPSKNPELKRKEMEDMHGPDLVVNVKLPDGSKFPIKTKQGLEVASVKNQLRQNADVVRKIAGEKEPVPSKVVFELLHEGRLMLEPMSICDTVKLDVGTKEIEVTLVVASK